MTDRPNAPDAGWENEARDLLRRVWGHPDFRRGQIEIIGDVLAGRDVLGVLPTGAGKSVCFQVPALLTPGLTLVVSPLVALMADQVSGLKARGVAATFLNSTLSNRETERRWDDLFAGRYRLLYVAPERLSTEVFRARAARLGISRIAVDEAHCVSEWGHDFRPEYRMIGEAREWLGGVPIVALTATATPAVRRDIRTLLGLQMEAVHVHGFDRPNITWSVFHEPDKAARLLEVLEGVPGGGIVYSSSRAGTEQWAARLRKTGHSVSFYHAGMPAADRAVAQDDWASARTRIMVATSAFGMGIDRSDVRFVAHVDLPASLEAYYQEAGRAGRDGRPAHAVLLWTEADGEAGERRIEAEHPSVQDIRRVFDIGCSMAGIAIGSPGPVPFVLDMPRVAAVTGFPVSRVRRAVEFVERQGVWSRQSLPDGWGLLHVRGDLAALKTYGERLAGRSGVGAGGTPAKTTGSGPPDGLAADLTTVAIGLVRHAPGEALSGWWAVEQVPLAQKIGVDPSILDVALELLQERDFLVWFKPGRADRFVMPGPRPERLPVDAAAVRANRVRALSRFRSLVRYASLRGCRRHAILAFFGESSPARCGNCDDCLGRHRPFVVTPRHEPVLRAMLDEVVAGGAAERAADALRLPAWKRRALADWLIQSGYLEPDDTGGGPATLTKTGREFIALSRPGPRRPGPRRPGPRRPGPRRPGPN